MRVVALTDLGESVLVQLAHATALAAAAAIARRAQYITNNGE